MHKKIHNNLHSYHASKLLTNYEVTEIHTRKSEDVHINEFDKTLAISNSINLKVGSIWNALDSVIKSGAYRMSVATFSKHVKNVYISKYSNVCTKENCYVCNNE